jgi:hypothetical protein
MNDPEGYGNRFQRKIVTDILNLTEKDPFGVDLEPTVSFASV